MNHVIHVLVIHTDLSSAQETLFTEDGQETKSAAEGLEEERADRPRV